MRERDSQQIQYQRTLVYYDGVQVFEARDAAEALFIAVMTPEAHGQGRYAVVPVAADALCRFRDGLMDLRSLMLAAGDAWYLTEPHTNQEAPISITRQSAPLSETDLLPEPGFLLRSGCISEALSGGGAEC